MSFLCFFFVVSCPENEWDLFASHTEETQKNNDDTLRIQVCPKKGITPTILLCGWD